MSKRLLFILAFALATSLVHAQKVELIDSLEQELKKEIPDSGKIEILLALSKAYEFVDFSKCFVYAQDAVSLAEEKDLQLEKAKSYANLAHLYTLSGDYSSALKFNNKAQQSNLELKDSVLIANTYRNIGVDYYDLGEYDESYFYLTQSYSLAKANSDSIAMAQALHNLGRVFKELGQYDQALGHLTISRNLSKRSKNTLGEVYYYDELGDIQLRKEAYDSALSNLLHALKLARMHTLNKLTPKTLHKIAHVYLAKEDYISALAYYDTAYLLHKRTNNQFGIGENKLGRGIVYYKQQKFAEAQQLIEQCLTVATKLNARKLAIQCHQQLYMIWEQRGDYAKALDYFKQFKVLEDSLFSQEMQQKLYRDQIRFETESRDIQIATLSQRDARQQYALKREEFIRNILVVVVALSVILLVTVYRSGRRRKQINRLLVEHQKETKLRSEELERLNQVKDKFFSIISHDLRSPINALSGILDIMAKGGLTAEEFDTQTHELRVRFNHTRTLLNNLLDWTLLQMDKLSLQPAKIAIHKIVDENIELLSSLQTKQINLINNIPESAIGFADSNTVNLVIRNLMTNAIKFTNDGGEVLIEAKEAPREWLISVHDNGIGITPEVQRILFDKTAPYTTRGTANEKGTGLGLILCKEFIEKNGGKIWVQSSEGMGSTFWFTLPKP